MSNRIKNLVVALPVWSFALLLMSCEETISVKTENCKEIITEAVGRFSIKFPDDKDHKNEERSSLGTIRFELISLFVLVHNRQITNSTSNELKAEKK